MDTHFGNATWIDKQCSSSPQIQSTKTGSSSSGAAAVTKGFPTKLYGMPDARSPRTTSGYAGVAWQRTGLAGASGARARRGGCSKWAWAKITRGLLASAFPGLLASAFRGGLRLLTEQETKIIPEAMMGWRLVRSGSLVEFYNFCCG